MRYMYCHSADGLANDEALVADDRILDYPPDGATVCRYLFCYILKENLEFQLYDRTKLLC